MPFTLAHPAIILPLKYLPRKWISMTALLVGSVMPDCEAFIRTYSEKELTHNWFGFFVFGLPMGVVASFLFHNVVRDPLINHLPGFLRQRFSDFTSFNWNQRFLNDWPVIILSMVIGAASHFFWDSFSHFDGWFLNLFPQLDGYIYLFQRDVEIPFLIQYINTLLGLLVIVVFIRILPRRKNKSRQKNLFKFWAPVICLAIALAFPRFIYLPVNSADDIMVGLISTFSFALIFVSFFFKNSGSEAHIKNLEAGTKSSS